MKIQHLAIIFVIIILPFSIICRSVMSNYSKMLKDQVRLNNVIDSATQDSLDMLVELNDEFQMLYFNQRFDINQAIATESVKSFFQTLAINHNMPYINGDTESYFSMYVPAILIIGYDGFFIYSVDEDVSGFAYRMSPKIPYAYYDKQTGTIVHFTLGNDISLFTNNKLYEGTLSCNYSGESMAKYREYSSAFTSYDSFGSGIDIIEALTNDMSVLVQALIIEGNDRLIVPRFLIPPDEDSGKPGLLEDYTVFGKEPSDFHKIRRETIINIIKETLQEEMNEHNTYAKMFGSNYDFGLPDIPTEDWTNSINDISIMSFIQGMPVGVNEYYDNYALSGSRIVQTDYYYGAKHDDTGGNYYHHSTCPLIKKFMDGTQDDNNDSVVVDNIFITREHAAQNGYYPCNSCKP